MLSSLCTSFEGHPVTFIREDKAKKKPSARRRGAPLINVSK
jgi:hypothetical protein